jgi:ABC-type sugar transport system ATPase subunit
MIFQDVLLAVNAALIAWYLWETRKLRLAAEDQVTKSQSQISATHEQVEAMRQQVAIAQDQREAQIRPALTVIGKGATLWVVNIGNGPALNLQLVRGKNQTVLPVSSRSVSEYSTVNR